MESCNFIYVFDELFEAIWKKFNLQWNPQSSWARRCGGPNWGGFQTNYFNIVQFQQKWHRSIGIEDIDFGIRERPDRVFSNCTRFLISKIWWDQTAKLLQPFPNPLSDMISPKFNVAPKKIQGLDIFWLKYYIFQEWR